MMKYFNYDRSADVTKNDIVDAALALARETYENNKSADYAEKNALLCENIGKYALAGTNYESEFETAGLSMYNRPMVKNSTVVRENFNAIIAQIVTAIVPEVVNDTFTRFIAEVKQVGYGETSRFLIQSNELFRVNQKAEGVRKGVDQPMFDNEITVNAKPYTID